MNQHRRNDRPPLAGLATSFPGRCWPAWILGLSLMMTGHAAAQIDTPVRPVTDPKALNSPVNANARALPVADLMFSRSMASAAWSPDGRQVYLSTNLSGRLNIWRVDADGDWPAQLTQSDDAQRELVVSRDGATLYYVQDVGGDEMYDIWSVPSRGGAPVKVTATPDVREYNMTLAPDSQTAVISTKRRDQAQVELGLLDLRTRATRTLVAEPDGQYRWAPVAWIEGGRALIAERGNANQTEAALFRIDAATGERTPILARPNTLYQGGGATSDGRLIAVSSNENSGQLRAGVYDVVAKRFRWAKPTVWEQTAGEITPDGRRMIVRTVADGRTVLTLLDVATLVETPLPIDPGQSRPAPHEAFSRDSSRLLVARSGADAPTELFIVDLASNTTRQLTKLAMASVSRADLPKSTVVTYRSFDRTLVSAIVTMPFNLARDGAAPAIVMPHGGPTSQSQDGFSATAAAFASRGFVVIQPNFRGSTGYGHAFQVANTGDLGGGDLKDVLAAKDYLVASGYVDARRVGITGGSYGGFMTLIALAKAPDAFAAGVQQFGIIDWRTMQQTSDPLLRAYVTALLGDPVKQRAAYAASSPITYIANIKAPLLTIQGDRDTRVPVDQARQLEAALKQRGGVIETVIYPQEGHGLTKRENQIDALNRTLAWFETYLAPARTAPDQRVPPPAT